MLLSKNTKWNSLFVIQFTLAIFLSILVAGCFTLSPRVKEMSNLGDGDSSGVPKLIEGLNDKDVDVRSAALESIEELGPQAKDALPALIKLLTNPGSRDYNLPIKTTPGSNELGYEHLGRKIEATAEGVGHVEFQDIRPKDSGMRAWLIVADRDVERPILAFYEIALGEVIMAIGSIGPAAEPAVPSLVLFLRDTQSWDGESQHGRCVSAYNLRLAAAEALSKIGASAKRALPDLEWALKDEKQRLNSGCDNQKAYDIIEEAISKVKAAK